MLRHARAPGPQRPREPRTIETARVDWTEPEALIRRGPFDVVLAADVLYERGSVAPLLSLLPQLAPVVWLADPDRPAAAAFLEQAGT